MTLALITGLLSAMSACALWRRSPDPGFDRIEVELWVAEVDASLAVLADPMTGRRRTLERVVELMAVQRRAERRVVTRAALDGLAGAVWVTERRLAA